MSDDPDHLPGDGSQARLGLALMALSAVVSAALMHIALRWWLG